jgi:hypothetical protein
MLGRAFGIVASYGYRGLPLRLPCAEGGRPSVSSAANASSWIVVIADPDLVVFDGVTAE